MIEEGPERYLATWEDEHGKEQSAVFTCEREAVAEIARKHAGGLRFHDLRHSYATWLVYDGVPINDAQRLLGHSKPSTTLDLYTHYQRELDPRVGELFAEFLPSFKADDEAGGDDEDEQDAV